MHNTLSHRQFVLIKQNKQQQKLIWRKTNPEGFPKQKKRSLSSKHTFNYKSKKQIIKNLFSETKTYEKQLNFIDQFRVLSRQKRISYHNNQQLQSTSSIPNYIYTNPQRAQTAQQKSTYSKTRTHILHTPIPYDTLKQKISQSIINKSRVIAVIKIRRMGLRYKIKYCFLELSSQTNNEKFVYELKEFFDEYKILKKIPYLFHLTGEPINNIQNEINPQEYVIITDFSPKLNLEFQAKMHIFDQASKLQESIRISQRQFGRLTSSYSQQKKEEDNNQDEQFIKESQQNYEWKKINNVKKYVDYIVQNPERINLKSVDTSQKKNRFKGWLNEKFEEPKVSKQNDKNPLFQTISHYPQQIVNAQMLTKVNLKLQKFDSIKNKHQYKQNPMDILLERVKREEKQSKETNLKKSAHPLSAKQFQRKLDKKNSILSSQNIPFIMEKYGIVRSQAHNLYAIYKTLEKVSAVRGGNLKHCEVYERGIDRDTFDEGMKGLEINPGDEVIRNICQFPDYISWQQFLKIVSISLRKTPTQKLQAILQGIGGSNNGFLTQLHIDIMVGSSLNKIFNHDEPELKKYFVSVVIKQLDPQGTGQISIERLKNRVLGRTPQNMDIVSFLMLNS